MTSVHRYPPDPPASRSKATQRKVKADKSNHTSFAAVLLPRRPGQHAVVATLIVDLDEYRNTHHKGSRLMGPLLQEINAWMH